MATLCDSEGKEFACSAGDQGSIPGLGKCPREGNGNPLRYSCLGNPVDRGAWWATVHSVAKSSTWLSNQTMTATLRSFDVTKPECPEFSSKNLQTINAREGMENSEPRALLVECKLVWPLWWIAWSFLKKLKPEPPYDPATPLLDIRPEKTVIHKGTCTPMFSAALFQQPGHRQNLSVPQQTNR